MYQASCFYQIVHKKCSGALLVSLRSSTGIDNGAGLPTIMPVHPLGFWGHNDLITKIYDLYLVIYFSGVTNDNQ